MSDATGRARLRVRGGRPGPLYHTHAPASFVQCSVELCSHCSISTTRFSPAEWTVTPKSASLQLGMSARGTG